MKKIAVLFHEKERPDKLGRYQIVQMADYWRGKGLDVSYLFGTNCYEPADLVIVHVNLSVVPQEYLDFASKYPKALNGRVRDIRKSSFSKNLLDRNTTYSGKVIVKSDLNYAGIPERHLTKTRLARGISKYVTKLSKPAAWFRNFKDYRIYENIREVPYYIWECPAAVVEKFLPEIEEGHCFTRFYQFFGDRTTSLRRGAKGPIVNGSTYIVSEHVEPPREIETYREKLGFDFGKFDYVVSNNEVVLLDINKTIGAKSTSQDVVEHRHYRAEGLFSYLK